MAIRFPVTLSVYDRRSAKLAVVAVAGSISRRALLKAAAIAGAAPLFATAGTLSITDDRFLEDLSRRAFLYFWEQADPHSGLVLDRAAVDGRQLTSHSIDVASTASTGFALTACCIGAARHWIEVNSALERVRSTLRQLAFQQAHHFGWYYHFVNRQTGERAWNSEVSTIDTALLLAGVLTAQQCFADDREIDSLARRIYERVDFLWMLDRNSGFLRMAWKPESGFSLAEWVDYRENVLLHILAMGSSENAIPADTWFRFARDPIVFAQYGWVGRGPIFTHQFPQAYLDLSHWRDGLPFGINYFDNSIVATYAHRAYCLSLRSFFPGLSEQLWGVTPSDSRIGYVIWGGWDINHPRHDLDGTVVPCAVAGSLMFAPEICIPSLRKMQEDFGERIYGRYGFADAFHPESGWVNPDVLGIDQGIALLSAENLRSGRVWEWFMQSPPVKRSIEKVFQPVG
jgi:hypothetical protein